MRRTLVLLGLGSRSARAARAADSGEPARRSAAGPHPLRRSEARRAADRRSTRQTPTRRPDLPLKIDEQLRPTAEDVRAVHGDVKPYKEHFLLQMEYTGPGPRRSPNRSDVKTVKIGFIGPIMPTVSVATGGKSHEEALGIKMLQGCRLAIEEANARGGYLKRKIPFELVVSNDNGLWGSSGNEIIKLAYKDNVWAILGTIDGANSHIAIRVALKAEIAHDEHAATPTPRSSRPTSPG